jgi:hypothetical protein
MVMEDAVPSIADRFDIKEFQEEVTEIHCHNCNGYIRFTLDKSKNGNHILNCPKCGHEHCRVVRDGIVTDERFDSRNNYGGGGGYATYTYQLTMSNYSTTGTQVYSDIGGTNDPYLQSAWMNQYDTTPLYQNNTTYASNVTYAGT